MAEFSGAGSPPKTHRVVVEGETYDVKDDLKRLGFRWDGDNKQWAAWVRDEDVDAVFMAVEDLGVTCEFDE